VTSARRVLLTAGSALALIGISADAEGDPILLWNGSRSVPVGLYALTPVGDLQRGALVAVRPPAALDRWLVESGYLGPETPLLKRIAGLPGAEVCRHGRTITVDGAAIAEARERDRRGRRLPGWQGCRRLEDAEVFLLNAEEPESLDGRYFGPLGIGTIIGRATPLWTD
jgi:conjugative transfer signal peptidase TraF